MKFELKTENENLSNSFSLFLGTFLKLGLIIVFIDIALKLGILSRNQNIEYNCRILSVEKSKLHFKKLSRLSTLKSKQQIWEFCREVIK